MKSRKRLHVFVVAFITIAIMAFGSKSVRIIIVDEFAIADSNVKSWLEETVEKEKVKPYPDNKVVLDIFTTRNSIIANSGDESSLGSNEIGSYGIDGYVDMGDSELLIRENKLEGMASAAFEKIGKKLILHKIKGRSFSFEEMLQEQQIDFDQYYYKFTDGEWAISDYDGTYGEENRERSEQWLLEHPDTLVFKTAVAPSFVERYDSLNEKNINLFVNEWKEWSNELKTYSADFLVNEAVSRVYAEYKDTNQEDTCAFVVLPGYIEARVYSGSFDENEYGDYLSSDEEWQWEYMMKSSKRQVYVPSCDADKEVVYMTSEIGDLLSQYIGGDYVNIGGDYVSGEVDDTRLADLRHHIPVEPGHCFGWHFCTMPQIFGIYLYDDGFVADIRTSRCNGEVVFIPYDIKKEKKRLTYWQE